MRLTHQSSKPSSPHRSFCADRATPKAAIANALSVGSVLASQSFPIRFPAWHLVSPPLIKSAHPILLSTTGPLAKVSRAKLAPAKHHLARLSKAVGLWLPATCIVLAAATMTAEPASAQGWPSETKNLQVLPADTPVREVIAQMRGYALALGVRCQHCHIGEEGLPLSEFDFAADTKLAKQRARTMIKMTQAINSEHLAKLSVPKLPVPKFSGQGGALTVQCVTCHRGTTRPEQLQDLLARIAAEKGSSAAIDKYSALREQYYGSGTFDFGEGSLIGAAESLMSTDQTDAAAKLLQLNLEHYPDSPWTESILASAYEKLDRATEALAIWKRLLDKSPGNPRIEQQVKRLEAVNG